MNTEKQKQVVVNVSSDAKTKIKELKEKFDVSDKEFIDSVLVVLSNTDESVITDAVQNVLNAKKAAKIAAKLAKLESEVAAEKGEG